MAKSKKIPDAWEDDDWETQADKLTKEETTAAVPSEEEASALSKQERLARHREEQRRIWESAEVPPEPAYLPMTNNVPLALTTPIKPTVKLLSRKPAPRMIARRDPVTGLEQLTLQDDDEDQDTQPQKIETLEEIQERQRREHAEKKARYEEARAKIFAESNPSSGQSTPGTVTPPQYVNEGRQEGGSGGGRGRGRGRGRGGGRGGAGGGGGRGDYNNNNGNGRQQQSERYGGGNRRQQPADAQQQTEQPTRQLYDPNYSPRSTGANTPRRIDGSPQLGGSRSHTPVREEGQPIRSPRGPDGSGRGGGGFSFARRGGAGTAQNG